MIWIYVLLVLTGSTACKITETGTPTRGVSEPELRVVASLDGVKLYEIQFEGYLAEVQGELYEDPMAEPPKRELFREFITVRLLLKEAQKEGFVINDSDVAELLKDWLTKERRGKEELSVYLRDYLTAQRFLHQIIQPQCEVSLGEMQTYYNAHHNEFAIDDQVHVLEIVVDSREEIETLANLTESTEIRVFMELARQHSKGLTASTGGDLGFFSRGELPEKFEHIVFALKPGEISEPTESIHGFHLFMVEECLPRHPRKFHEVRDQIFKELVASKERVAQQAYFTELLDKTAVEIYDESLEFRDREKKTDGKPAEF